MKNVNKTVPGNKAYGFAEYILGNAESQHVELTSHSNPATPDVDTFETVNIHNVIGIKQSTRHHKADINGNGFKVKSIEVQTADGATIYIKLFG